MGQNSRRRFIPSRTHSPEQCNIRMSFCALEERHGGCPVLLRSTPVIGPHAFLLPAYKDKVSEIPDFLRDSRILKTGLGISEPAANKHSMMSITSIIPRKRIFQCGDEFTPRGELVISYNLGFVGLYKLGILTQLKLVCRHPPWKDLWSN